MILTVTLNPAIDKTAEVEQLQVGGLNRLGNVMMDAGGKGVNVSKTIKALGGISVCTGFLAGSSGKYIEDTLDSLQIQSDFVWVEGMTRTNLKVLDKQMELTELNEAGPNITEQDITELMSKLTLLCEAGTYVVLSGNVPKGIHTDVYQRMIERIKKAKGNVIFDADGELFAHGIQAGPMVIKPNKFELATYFHVAQDSEDRVIVQLAKTLLNEDTKLVVVSMGKQGSIFITAEGVWQAEALSIDAHSSVGAGDAMVAAITFAMEARYPMLDMMKLAVACSAGAVMTKGTKPAEKAIVEELMDRVIIRKWEETK